MNVFDPGPGDLVQLKSGGPSMTVDRAPGAEGSGCSDTVACVWFEQTRYEGRKQRNGTFKVVALEVADKPYIVRWMR